MNIQEYTDKLKKASEELKSKMPDLIRERGLNAIAIIKKRFIQDGGMVGPSGEETSFPAYSKSYEKLKAKQGASTPNKLVYSGDMLKQLKIVEETVNNGKFNVKIGGSDAVTQRKMKTIKSTPISSNQKLDYNSQRYGDVLRLSKKEIKKLNDLMLSDIEDILLKHLK